MSAEGEGAGARASAEVVIIGAGAAGLAAAAVLSRAGCSALVLEARKRIGGRCLTHRHPALGVPIELGAEFIHGRPAATLRLLRKARTAAVESARTQRMLWRGRLRSVDAFAQAQHAFQDCDLSQGDVSFRAYLAGRRLPALSKTLATMMVQGFDAADPARISARSIAEEWASGEMGGSQSRPNGGYGPLLESLAGAGARLQLHTLVREVAWKRGGVRIKADFLGAPFIAKAKRAIVTLPLGVLQSHAVRFRPAIDEKRPALAALASGPVIHAALVFRSAFWRERFPDEAFFHAPRAPFPTFWTPLPARAPLLTAWAGGPKAARLAGMGTARLARLALRTVEGVLGEEGELTAAYVHDWQADPHARGGYSYVQVSGSGARELLAAPLQETLFFAGEATNTRGESGTVGGALQSGERAAREVLRTF